MNCITGTLCGAALVLFAASVSGCNTRNDSATTKQNTAELQQENAAPKKKIAVTESSETIAWSRCSESYGKFSQDMGNREAEGVIDDAIRYCHEFIDKHPLSKLIENANQNLEDAKNSKEYVSKINNILDLSKKGKTTEARHALEVFKKKYGSQNYDAILSQINSDEKTKNFIDAIEVAGFYEFLQPTNTTTKLGFLAHYTNANPACVDMSSYNQVFCSTQSKILFCPHGINCDVSIMFKNGAIKEYGVSYQYDQFEGDEIEKILEQTYGAPAKENKIFGPIYRWKHGSTRIQITRLSGTNINGEAYDNVSISFSIEKNP